MTEIADRTPGAQRMGFFTDTTVCIGCKACEVACKQWNDLPADGGEFRKGGSYDNTGELGATTWRHVRFVETEPATTATVDLVDRGSTSDQRSPSPTPATWVFMSDVCKHCTNAGCLDACPTGALIRTEFDTVVLQPDVCNGCGYCIPSCPFGVIDRDHDDGRAAKCTLCYDRLQDGLEPACAKACPTDSIQFGAYDDLSSVAERRVATLHERGVEDAYLYGAGRPTSAAGGLGAFFLLTEAPERYGLPGAAPTRRSRRTSSPRRWPRSAPGCWRRRASRRRSCARRGARAMSATERDMHARRVGVARRPAFGDARTGAQVALHATPGATRAGRTSTATTRDYAGARPTTRRPRRGRRARAGPLPASVAAGR